MMESKTITQTHIYKTDISLSSTVMVQLLPQKKKSAREHDL